MLDAAEQMVRIATRTELRLFTNPRKARNIASYERAGFLEIGRLPNPHRPGWVLIDMAKTIV